MHMKCTVKLNLKF